MAQICVLSAFYENHRVRTRKHSICTYRRCFVPPTDSQAQHLCTQIHLLGAAPLKPPLQPSGPDSLRLFRSALDKDIQEQENQPTFAAYAHQLCWLRYSTIGLIFFYPVPKTQCLPLSSLMTGCFQRRMADAYSCLPVDQSYKRE